jgi:hypothetical protein
MFNIVRTFRKLSKGMRRDWEPRVRLLLSFALMVMVTLGRGHGQAASPSGQSSRPPLNRFPRMVQEHFVKRARAIEARSNRRRAAMKTQGDAEAYVREVREKIQKCFGPWPDKTPLNPRVTGTAERDTYRIEKIIFESRPGFLVTANLYVPKNREFPLRPFLER